MQDLRSIPGAGQIFGVSGGGVLPGGAAAAGADRRLRPHPQQNLKCPRCDSHDTKFCYYNNYNLSQPRHFCKSCRRYWTKGGVLRNVPVGGGCRKSKRSSSSFSKPSTKSSSNGCKDSRRHSPADAASRSSSDSSTLTAATADAATVTQDPITADPGLDSYAAALLESINEGAMAPAGGDHIFLETGSFSGLIAAAANPDALGLSFDNGSQLHLPPTQQLPKTAPATPPSPRVGVVLDDATKMPGITVEQRYMDQMVQIDWQGGIDAPAGLFDSAGDHGGYWNHGQWGEIDPSLFLP